MNKLQRYEIDACLGYGCSGEAFKSDNGEWTKSSDTAALEARNKELEEENTRLHVRLNLLAGKCDTCGEVCEDSILEHWIEKAKSLEKENEELQARIDAYLKAQEPKECAAPVCGTLCKACEENI
jgi:hypothetical protein